ncbi:MAG: hypothetical protein IKQ50_03330 [Paludibacteraceae bacterium]|nr:hypothetical protein [Paludibacteraceae bacterium]
MESLKLKGKENAKKKAAQMRRFFFSGVSNTQLSNKITLQPEPQPLPEPLPQPQPLPEPQQPQQPPQPEPQPQQPQQLRCLELRTDPRSTCCRSSLQQMQQLR